MQLSRGIHLFFDTFERKSMDLDNTDYLLAIARVEEKNLNLERAAKIYERIIELDEDCISAYDRLMIVYRKLKQLKKELYVIESAIKAFYRKGLEANGYCIQNESDINSILIDIKSNRSMQIDDERLVKCAGLHILFNYFYRYTMVSIKIRQGHFLK